MFKKIVLLLAFAVASTFSFGQNELVLSAVSSNSQPVPWSFTSVTFTLQNNSFGTYSNVTVDLNLNNNLRLKGGDEYNASKGTLQDSWTNFPTWNVGNIGPSQEATITLNIFVLGSSAPSHVYGQVATALGDPLFSTPGNGVCCTPNERDEAVFNLNGNNPTSGGKPDMVINYWGNNPNPNQGGETFADFRFRNIGTADVGSFFYSIFLSNDTNLSPDDEFIRGNRYDLGIPAGQTRNVGITFPLPSNRSGQQYIIISIDPANEIDELNENNQIFFRSLFINSGGGGKADLIVSNISPIAPVDQGSTVPLNFSIKNNGGTATGNFSYRVHISTDPVFNQFPQPDPMVIDPKTIAGIPANGTRIVNTNFQLPAQFSGNYYVIILIDILDDVDESIENNNQGQRIFNIRSVGGFDLRPIIISVPDAFITPDVPGWVSTASFSIKNDGTETTPPSLHGLYISRDQQITVDDIYLGPRNTPSLAPGESQIFNQSFNFPESLTGNFYLLVSADAGNAISETNEQNNIVSRAFKTVSPGGGNGVDLELEMIQPTTPNNYAQWSFFEVPVKVTNRGTQAATGVEIEFRQTDLTTYKGSDEATVSQGDFYWWSNIWNVGTLQPNESAIMTVNLFRLSPNSFVLYSEVTAMNETDIDSSPDNGVCCGAGEDDEDAWAVDGANANSINNRSMIVDNLGTQPFAIVNATPNPIVNQFTLQVYSNEVRTSELTVENTLGQPVFRQEVELVKGHNTIPVRLENTAAGLHSVRMTPFHPHLRQFKVMKVQD